jgi:transposase
MRYELSDDEWTAINPMLPDKPRGGSGISPLRNYIEHTGI